MTTISVVLPTWNRSTALEAAIQSVLSQTYPPLEVLVCDDGSTDDTERVVKSIKDSRVVWLPGERSGRPAIPRNRGIIKSSGKWIAFLDDDDVWLPEKLEIQMKKLQNSGCAASCSDAFRYLPEEGRQGSILGLETDLLRFGDLLAVNKIICSSVLVRADVVKMAGGFPEDPSMKALEDYALWLRLSTLTDFSVVALPLLDYRDDPLQSIRKNGSDWLEQRRAVLDDFCSWSKNREGGYFAKALEVRNSKMKSKSMLHGLLKFFENHFSKSRNNHL